MRRNVLPPPPRRRLSRPVAAAGRDRDAVGGTRGGGSGAAHHRTDGNGDERHPEPERHPLHLAVRPLRRSPHLRARHGQLLRAPAGVRAAGRRLAAVRCHAQRRAALLPFRPDLPLRPGESRSLADGAENAGGLGHRAAVQIGSRRGRRLRARRADHAVPGAARSGQGGLGRPLRSAHRRVAERE